ncbi:copper transport protein ctr4 [Diaporthe amygdali]|uniref:copper transport protein ctr4 n=1 Tax=Phomopsis amygdali TaxID=1214568 RepID=UPI0022FDB34F|nr:copper transport protein ctr4 [Diaporthe amygdali]KAJ0123972.1 copper transport protein ctr4 [Diaporthe amygdali]
MDMDMTMSMGTCNSSMLWNWYTIDSCFLAESWHVTSNGAFAASCIGTILLVIVLEALRRVGKEYDDWILRGFQARAAMARLEQHVPAAAASSSSSSASASTGPAKGAATAKVTPASAAWKRLGGGGGGVANGVGGVGGRAVVFRVSPLQQLFRAVIHAAALGLAYIVMLLVMSYNGYIIICVIIGGGLGKFFCDWMTRQYVIDGDGSGEEEGAAGIEEPSVCCS